MRNPVLVYVLVLVSAASVMALDRSGPIMEVKVYVDNAKGLERLGDVMGELDVCTWGEDHYGHYLLIDTDAKQLAQIQATGLGTDVTYPDIRQKFFEMTGVHAGDIDAGRNFGYFFTYWEMQDTLARLAANFPSICVRTNAGLSHQGRQLWMLKISDNPGQGEDEPACFFNGASHAREPMGTHTCVMFAARLLSEYGHDSIATWLVNNREIYIIPVMNPDGYVYNSDSGGSSSNWRKNRRVIQSPSVGVDLNRNYGYKWGYDNQGSSSQPSSETYRGPSRFSEPETQVIRDLLLMNRFRTCMDFHTYGRYNMYPWGYASATPPDQAVLREAVDTFRVNNNYPADQTGQVNQTIYACNGLSVDWEYTDSSGKFITYAYTCELGTNDFWYGYNDSNYIRNEANLNVPNLYYLTRISGVFFNPVAVALNDSTLGNRNGQLDPGEAANVWFTVRNRATHPLDSAYAISARLVSGHADVTVPDSIKSFPSISRRGSGNNRTAQFQVLALGTIPSGTHVPLRLEVGFMDAGHTYMQLVNFEVIIGSHPVSVAEHPGVPEPVRLSVGPNPARDRVVFNARTAAGPCRLDIFTKDGARLTSKMVDGTYVWDCSAIPAGVYFCRATAGGVTTVARFTVVR